MTAVARQEKRSKPLVNRKPVPDGRSGSNTWPTTRFRALRRQPTQQRGHKQIANVLDATERLLKARHFDSITTEEIATEADIQIGSFYHFFESKTAVLITVLERALQAEADAFAPVPEDENRSLLRYLQAIEHRLNALWAPRIALLDLYFAYQRHRLIWAFVLELRVRVARDIGAKIRQLYPQLPIPIATAIGEQIGIVLAVLNDNIAYLGEAAQRRLARECLDMLHAYVVSKAARARSRKVSSSRSHRTKRLFSKAP